MSHKIELRLETFVCGLFIIQPQYDEADFENLIGDFLAPSIKRQFADAYRDLENSHGGCFCRDDQTPWVIVVFGSDSERIRRTTLHEVVHLAEKLTCTREMRARFVEHVYFALRLP
jgi:hypothetical protein